MTRNEDPNVYARNAKDNIDLALERNPRLEGEEYIAVAQAQASLAIAFEQRTANLIAFFSDNDLAASTDCASLFEQIEKRLDLE